MKILKTKKYDLFVSLGAACSCSTSLRNAKLQFYSYPFDWVGGPDIISRIKFFPKNFEDFIIKENLTFSGKVDITKCDAYKDEIRGMLFNHDFKQGRDFDEMFEEVKTKFQRRAKRLIEQIKSSKNVLFVYMHSPNQREFIQDDVLIESANLLKEIFPNVRCDILHIICERDSQFKKRVINDNVTQLIFDYDARIEKEPWVVNLQTLDKVFRHLSITTKHLTKENIKDMRKYKLKNLLKGKLWEKI